MSTAPSRDCLFSAAKISLDTSRLLDWEVLHDLRCGFALSPVRHDLPSKKKKKNLQLFIVSAEGCTARYDRVGGVKSI